MSDNQKSNRSQFLLSISIFALICMASSVNLAVGYPTGNLDLLSQKLENGKASASQDLSAERSFHQFIHQSPQSTVIGQIDPNADLMDLKNKIADAILSIQEDEKTSNTLQSSPDLSNGRDCFIEVKKIERVAGKCHKTYTGLPICQSDNYMAVNSECS